MAEPMEILGNDGESISLPEKFKNISINALRVSARKKLALYLNVQSEIVNESNGLVSDYNGLAEMIGFGFLEIKNFERQKNPTEELLLEWTEHSDLNPTIGKLWEYLVELGRIDVLEDCRNLIIRDADAYLKVKEQVQNDYIPVQEDSVSTTEHFETAQDHHVDELAVLCKDDVTSESPTYFDAFVCYSPVGNDLAFVKDMIDKLENEPHNLKLFVPWRDDLPGGARYVIDAKLIESRCRRMVIIMSKNYQNSAAADFQVKFAHALSPGARSKKLIPVLIETNVQIPQVLRHVTLCDFTKQDLKDWFWDRLSKAIKAPLDPQKSPYGSKSTPSSEIASGGIMFDAGSNPNVREELSHIPSHKPATSTSSVSSLSSNMSCSPSTSLASSFSSEPMEHEDTSTSQDSQVKKSKTKKTFFKNFIGKKSNSSSNTSSHC